MKKYRILAWLVLLVSMTVLCCAGAENPWTDEQWEKLNQQLSNDNADAAIETEWLEFDHQDLSEAEGLDENWMHILLLGVDNPKIDGPITGRSDAMLILSVNQETGEARLSSIVRDLYVQLPLIGWPNRINAAYVFGGPYYTMKTVNETFGLNIRKYCTIDLRGFTSVVDLLGGVEIELSEGETVEINKDKSVETPVGRGLQKLNGQQALSYVRLRATDNNFGRNERQRKFLVSMMQAVLSQHDIGDMLDIAEMLLSHMETNLTAADTMKLIFSFLPKLNTLETYSCPQSGEYRFVTTEQGAEVVEAIDIGQVAKNLKAFIYGSAE